jgi:hypothetical protein
MKEICKRLQEDRHEYIFIRNEVKGEVKQAKTEAWENFSK